jgi:hypothetical protein
MIYLTNDALDQAVYFDLRSSEPHRHGNDRIYFGLLGNGVHEVSVTVRKSRCGTEVTFGKSDLFKFIEEDQLRQMLGDVLKGKTIH